MLTAEQNELLVRVGPGTKMGELLRRYWMPIAGVTEFDERDTKPIRLMGEDLVLYKDLSGGFGLIDQHCAHRSADMSYGIVEENGLRCNYHGWCFDAKGDCIEQPFEDTVMPDRSVKSRVKIKAYPVEVKAGLVWAYLGPAPAPLVPDWDLFSRPDGFVQIVLADVPCNWFQCQENSIDPVHFEWMHENWGNRMRHGSDITYGPTHVKLDFEEFEYGFVYKRVREDTDESHPFWTIGRTALWPNCFYLGEHFEWRVPIDDENTLSVTWKFTHVPKDREPYVQAAIPTWTGPVKDENGRWITSHVMNQDFLAWAGQGRITDRTREKLGTSDRGIAMMRRRFFDEMEKLADPAYEPKGLIRDAAKNVCVKLPMAARDTTLDGYTTAEIMADPRKRLRLTSYMFQAGQPERVKRLFSAAMGIDEVQEFEGLTASKAY